MPTFLAKAACFEPGGNESGLLFAESLTAFADLSVPLTFQQTEGQWARIEGTAESIAKLRAVRDMTRPGTLKGLKVSSSTHTT